MSPRRRPARRGGAAVAGIIASAAVMLAAAIASRAEERSAVLASMVEAERAFARAAAARGVRAAFLEYLDDASIAFEPRIGPARDAWNARPVPANPLADRLAWEPRTGDVSADGRLGWLTGPYVLVPDGDERKTAYGCYFSIWRRAPDGPWRVYIDQGISTPNACDAAEGFVPYAAVESPGPALTRESLVAADTALGGRIRDAGAATFAGVLDDNARLHRHGHQPVVGAGAVRAYLESAREAWTFEMLDGVVAGSGDLGFTYGRAVPTAGAAPRQAYYVRVWRRGPGGQWRLVFDTVS